MTAFINAVTAFLKDLDAQNDDKLRDALASALRVQREYDALIADPGATDQTKETATNHMAALTGKFGEWLLLHGPVRAPLTPFVEVESAWVEALEHVNHREDPTVELEWVVDFNARRYRQTFRNKIKFPRLAILGASRFEQAVSRLANNTESAVGSEYSEYQNLDKKQLVRANRDLSEERANNQRAFAQ
jgi:hypothetical protein